MARAIDADVLLKKLQRMIDYCKDDNQVNGLTVLFQVGDAIMDCATLTPPNEALTMEQLREMKDKPAYLKVFDPLLQSGWHIIKAVTEDKIIFRGWHTVYVPISGMGVDYNLYRRPPEGEDGDATRG